MTTSHQPRRYARVPSRTCVALILERFYALKKARIDAGDFTSQIRTVLLKNEDIKQAVKICENYRGPIAAIVKAGLLKYGRPKGEIEKTIENAALHEMASLERGLVGLATMSNVAPITGFLGTVVGMIASFDRLAVVVQAKVGHGFKGVGQDSRG